MFSEKQRVSSGIQALDRRLDGLYIGDNVIWYDEAGSLAFPFCLNFMRESLQRAKSMVYVTFDRSPKTLLQELGPLAQNADLTILDCFTHGKGDGSPVFARFYEDMGRNRPFHLIKVAEPAKPDKVSEAIYSIHQDLKGDVRFIFESLTGMQDLWGGEEGTLKFYTRSCPRLYELDTVAYWIIEKGAHSSRLKAHINQIAQVAIELGLKRGKSTLSIIKAHNRHPDIQGKPEIFWVDGMTVGFDADTPISAKIDLGSRLKNLRSRQGLAQKELAGLLGVTPSTISQIESNLIYPSLPALFKLAQVMSVDTAYFFQKDDQDERPVVFSGGTAAHFPHLPKGGVTGYLLLPANLPARIEAYLLEIAPQKKIPGHFFIFKGHEVGYLLQGRLMVTIKNNPQQMRAGDLIYLTRDIPSQWKNPDGEPAKMLWFNLIR